MERFRFFAPIVAAVLLLVPVLYVGSYLALVRPGSYPEFSVSISVTYEHDLKYRCCGKWAATIFWPLEQMDRKLRPEAWEAWSAGGGVI